MPLRLYLDEDVLPSIARLLRQRGHDVVSAHEVGHQGWEDEEHLIYASSVRRVLVSHNAKDYIPLSESWFRSEREHAGIVIGHRQNSRPQIGLAVQTLARLIDSVSEESMRNTVRYLEEFIQDAH